MANRGGENTSSEILFSWAPKSLWTVTAAMNLKGACFWMKWYDKPSQQRTDFVNKGLYSQSYGFSSSYV